MSNLIFHPFISQNSPQFAPTKFDDNDDDGGHHHHHYHNYLDLIWTCALICFTVILFINYILTTSIEDVSYTPPPRSLVSLLGPFSRFCGVYKRDYVGAIIAAFHEELKVPKIL